MVGIDIDVAMEEHRNRKRVICKNKIYKRN